MDTITIRIKNLRLRTYIGFNPDEKRKKQDVIINIQFSYQAETAHNEDDMKDMLNYKTMTKSIIKLVEKNTFLLLEKLTHDILALIFENEKVAYAKVEVDKPHALRFSDSVSAQMTRRR